MKPMLIIIGSLLWVHCFSQELPDVQKLQKPFMLDIRKRNFSGSDSARIYFLPQNRNVMPNAFIMLLPTPRLAGNNGGGQEIYVLPLDNMPMIKPDSSYYSQMPVAGRRLN